MANLILRLPNQLHKVSKVAAASQGKSLNKWIVQAIRTACLRQASEHRHGPVASIISKIEE